MPQLSPTRYVSPEILSGRETRLLLGRSAANLGARHVLLVTDPGVERAGWAGEAAASLTAAGVAHTVFDDVTPNPRATQVHAGAEVYARCGANAIVVVGGGSPVDCAKGIGIVAVNGGSILDYEGVDRIPSAIPPLLCVPTTAGAAADASQFAIITDEAARTKIGIVSKTLVPDLTLLDPVVLTTKPAALTAATGIDTLCHAIEASVSTAASPFTDLLALEAIRILVVALPRCLEAPADLGARGAMQLACLYAGLAFSNASLGAVHALAHALGGLLDLPHGECNAILLPHVAAWNFTAAPGPLRRVGAALGLALDGLPDTEAAARLGEALTVIARQVGITARLGDVGVRREDLEDLARKAIEDPCMATNPRPPTEADVVALLTGAL